MKFIKTLAIDLACSLSGAALGLCLFGLMLGIGPAITELKLLCLIAPLCFLSFQLDQK